MKPIQDPVHGIDPWQHPHDYITTAEVHAERRTRWVLALTLVTMVVELAAGWVTGSMALLADGWHMGSHAAAMGISALAYAFARQRRDDRRFTFGTGKVSSLAGYSSSLLLAGGALWMLVESITRLFDPVSIHYRDAMAVAALGLAVNVASAWLLGHGHDDHHHHGHDHHQEDDHDHDHHHQEHERHQDHNLRAAYLHVLADALTSVLALIALGFGMAFGWAFLDPMMGIAGAALVGRWSWGLARDSARVLLDAEDHGELAERVQTAIEGDADNQVTDLHLWRIGAQGRACIVSLVTHDPRPVEHYRALLAEVPGIVHLTVEVNHCLDEACRTNLDL
jgi:cation diffusion facilitator family transporter